MLIQPYLFFEGRSEEAIEFYRRAVNAEVIMKMLFKDSPEPTMHPPELADKVMHARLRIGESTLLLSDGRCEKPASFQGFSLTINASDEAEADRVFNALVDGGKTLTPLTKTFFSPRFGMLADRFGVMWMVIVGHK